MGAHNEAVDEMAKKYGAMEPLSQTLGTRAARRMPAAFFYAERTPSLCLYPGNGGFYCFGCHAHGDAVALYAQALSLSLLEAAKRVCAERADAVGNPAYGAG